MVYPKWKRRERSSLSTTHSKEWVLRKAEALKKLKDDEAVNRQRIQVLTDALAFNVFDKDKGLKKEAAQNLERERKKEARLKLRRKRIEEAS